MGSCLSVDARAFPRGGASIQKRRDDSAVRERQHLSVSDRDTRLDARPGHRGKAGLADESAYSMTFGASPELGSPPPGAGALVSSFPSSARFSSFTSGSASLEIQPCS